MNSNKNSLISPQLSTIFFCMCLLAILNAPLIRLRHHGASINVLINSFIISLIDIYGTQNFALQMTRYRTNSHLSNVARTYYEITRVRRSCEQLNRIIIIRCIRPYLDSKRASTIAASIVHSKFDYCNSLSTIIFLSLN